MKISLDQFWYRPAPPPGWLRPLATLYGSVSADLARTRKAAAVHLPVPVIVVGNITVGGTGKTPFVLWLVERLREQGWRPGVISRGYGGCSPEYPLRVTPATDPAWAGDEPALIARRLDIPVAVAPDRVAGHACCSTAVTSTSWSPMTACSTTGWRATSRSASSTAVEGWVTARYSPRGRCASRRSGCAKSTWWWSTAAAGAQMVSPRWT